MRCHYVKDGGKRYLIPGCWSNALSNREDMRDCTCYKPIGVKKKQTIEHLEHECSMLRDINDRLNAKNRILLTRIAELENNRIIHPTK